MAQKVLILGESGTGKSASMRNFTPDEILVINSAGKQLPFRNKFEVYTPSYQHLSADIMATIRMSKKPVIVVDDAQYIMSFQYMRRIKENGWDKWNDIQGDFFNIIRLCDELPETTIVYFLSHIQRDENGREKIKTMGKMLDEKITIEGLFTTVLKTGVKDGEYYFFTQNSGMDTVKSPMGMFPTYAIDNDLKYVDEKIRNYYEIGEYIDDEEIKKLDKEVAKEVQQEQLTARGTRRRRTGNNNDGIDAGTSASVGSTGDVDGQEPALTKPEEAPKRRRRATAPTVEPSEKPEELEQPEEKPKRRRRARFANTITADDIEKQDSLDLNAEEFPF